jgi:hypothetical protein
MNDAHNPRLITATLSAEERPGEALSEWEHPLTQAAYKTLCSEEKPLDDEFWNGFVERYSPASFVSDSVFSITKPGAPWCWLQAAGSPSSAVPAFFFASLAAPSSAESYADMLNFERYRLFWDWEAPLMVNQEKSDYVSESMTESVLAPAPVDTSKG